MPPICLMSYGKPLDLPQRRRLVVVGKFESWHRGHRFLFEKLKALRKGGEELCVLTFTPFFCIDGRPRPSLSARLYDLRDRLALMEAAGVDRIVVLRSHQALFSLKPAAFVREILVDTLGAATVAVGAEFRFGRDRAADAAALKDLGRRYGFEVETAALQKGSDGTVYSTTAVRAALAAGNLEKTQRILGRPFHLSGRVGHGNRLGHTIGFPTANIAVRQRVSPPQGVYVGAVVDGLSGRPLAWALANIGIRPTIGDRKLPLLEAHLLDFDGDLYGRFLRVFFLKSVRGQKKFDSLEALQRQIGADVAYGRRWLQESLVSWKDMDFGLGLDNEGSL